MTTVTPADNPACSFDLYMNEGKCCPCTALPCHPGLDLRMSEATITGNHELGLNTDGCNFTTSKEQRLLFFARRRQDGNSLMVYQLIGFTDVKPLPSDGSVAEVTVNGSIVGPLIGVVIVLALAILLFIATGVGCIYLKRRKDKGFDIACMMVKPWMDIVHIEYISQPVSLHVYTHDRNGPILKMCSIGGANGSKIALLL